MTDHNARARVFTTRPFQVGDVCRICASDKVAMPPELIGLLILLVKEFRSEHNTDSFFEVSLPDDPDTRLEREGKTIWIHETVLLLIRSVIPPKRRGSRP